MPFDLGYVAAHSRLARPDYDGTGLQDVAAIFSTEDACIEHVMMTRFGNGVPCQNRNRQINKPAVPQRLSLALPHDRCSVACHATNR